MPHLGGRKSISWLRISMPVAGMTGRGEDRSMSDLLAHLEQHAARIAALRQELADELQRRDETIRGARDAGYRPAVIRAKAVVHGPPLSGSQYAAIVGTS
jgi:hypothetical protein